MRSAQAHLAVHSPLAGGLRVRPAGVYGSFLALFAAVLGWRPRKNGRAVPNYEGHAWCDATEVQLINDIATHRRAGF